VTVEPLFDEPLFDEPLFDEPLFDEQGLVAGIVQDAATGRVLMLGWLNQESLRLTRDTGTVHFWSRSRRQMWMKGETSGNTLELVDIALDCDRDALLLRVRPAGPTCHTGTTSCFDDQEAAALQGFSGLEDLWAVIAERAAARPDGSYTVELLDGGVDAVGRKVTEEATEVLLAAKDHAMGSGSDERVAEEAADLLYHLLVLLAERDITPETVLAALRARSG
jgi:phosphoribosyl-ATP pyrophosphohydrolase/phosphoribosyl-AMP cyclohydrolase